LTPVITTKHVVQRPLASTLPRTKACHLLSSFADNTQTSGGCSKFLAITKSLKGFVITLKQQRSILRSLPAAAAHEKHSPQLLSLFCRSHV